MTRIEALTPERVPDAYPLAEAWGYGHQEFDTLTTYTDGCARIAYDDENAIGITLGFPWGRVGWIGSVRVQETHRGQGIGQRLTEASIQALHEAGCETIKLYATPKAIPLYERIGFQGEAEYVTVTGSRKQGRNPDVVPLRDHLEAATQLDARIFPGDRARFLEDLAKQHPDLAIGVLDDEDNLAGYALARPGPDATDIGPVIIQPGGADQAQPLVDGILTRVPERPIELIHPKNAWAASNAWSCRGFVPIDTPLQMRLGPPVEERREAIVAAGGQEVG